MVERVAHLRQCNMHLDEKEEVAIEARKYELLEDLTHREGWKILLAQLERLKLVYMADLLKENDIKKIYSLQAKVTAFGSIINILSSAKSIKEALYHKVTEIIEDEQQKEEFDNL